MRLVTFSCWTWRRRRTYWWRTSAATFARAPNAITAVAATWPSISEYPWAPATYAIQPENMISSQNIIPLVAESAYSDQLAQALDAAGLPAGVLNLLIGPGSMGNSIVEHPALDGLTFTGSTGVGRRLASEAAGRGVPVQAEMGGKNAAVVLADADLERASNAAIAYGLNNSGQVCISVERIYVEDAVHGARDSGAGVKRNPEIGRGEKRRRHDGGS